MEQQLKQWCKDLMILTSRVRIMLWDMGGGRGGAFGMGTKCQYVKELSLLKP
jgi:hypothetical protein